MKYNFHGFIDFLGTSGFISDSTTDYKKKRTYPFTCHARGSDRYHRGWPRLYGPLYMSHYGYEKYHT